MTPEKLIRDLVQDLQPGRPRLSMRAALAVWMGASVTYVLSLTFILGPLRPGAVAALTSAPQFAMEMLLGIAAFGCLATAALARAVPGAHWRWMQQAGVMLALLWLLALCASMFWSALPHSMLGKREHCALEALLYSVPPALLGVYLQQRRYPLQPVQAAVLAGTAAGLLPALVMQVACMYDPWHAMQFHVLPALVPAALAGAGAAWISRRHAGDTPRSQDTHEN